jgi:ribosomal protein L17
MRSLVQHQSIVTTLPKAKELRPKMEKVISKARKGDLANRRRVIAALDDIAIGQFLVETLAPQIKRSSGYLRIVRLDESRVGDNAPLARVEFVDPITISQPETVEPPKAQPTEEKPAPKPAAPAKKPSKKTEEAK